MIDALEGGSGGVVSVAAVLGGSAVAVADAVDGGSGCVLGLSDPFAAVRVNDGGATLGVAAGSAALLRSNVGSSKYLMMDSMPGRLV